STEPDGRTKMGELFGRDLASKTSATMLREFLQKVYKEILIRQDAFLKKRGRAVVTFEVGEPVLMVLRQKRKMDPKLQGPFRIIKKIDVFHYEIDTGDKKQAVVHVANLRHCIATKEDLKKQQMVAAEPIDVIDHRKEKGQWQFLIKWKELEKEFSTWEMADEVQHYDTVKRYIEDRGFIL
ncbi:hypothetical protein ADUPG1_011519, partial [Aduncisulcus paluster]